MTGYLLVFFGALLLLLVAHDVLRHGAKKRARAKADADRLALLRANARLGLDLTLDELGDDEVRVIAHLAERLLAGQRAYARIDLARDARDFRKERGEEIADLLVYSAFMELKALTKKT